MNETLGLLFLICVTAIGLRLAAAKCIDWRSLIPLLLFGLLAGFVIARYRDIQWLGISKDVGVKTFQDKVDAITGEAVSKIQSEVDSQKQSLELVIADANVTREKLTEQRRSLETVYDKTKTLETRLDGQKNEIEDSIRRSGQIEQSLQGAQLVLDKLATETRSADEKLKLLDEKTGSIERLPDGRTKMGSFITGEPTLLEGVANKMVAACVANDFKTGYTLAGEAISMIESSEKAAEGAGISTATLNPPWVADVYRIAADCARIEGNPSKAVEWARTGMKKSDSGAVRAALFLALVSSHDETGANQLTAETLAMDPKIAQAYRDVLSRIGVILPQK